MKVSWSFYADLEAACEVLGIEYLRDGQDDVSSGQEHRRRESMVRRCGDERQKKVLMK